MSDNEHADGHVRPAPSDAAQIGGVREDDEPFDATGTLLRLLLGVLLVSADEMRQRCARWEAAVEPSRPPAALQTLAQLPRYGPFSASIHRALVGMLFETEVRTRQRLSNVAERLARFSETAEYLFTTRFEPTIRRTPLDPVMARLDEALFMAMATIDRWSAQGELEERQSRSMARHALASMADELLDYMSRSPQVRALIERQGAGIAEEAIDEVRDRTESADRRFERFAHSLLRRPVKDVDAGSTPGTDATATGDAGG